MCNAMFTRVIISASMSRSGDMPTPHLGLVSSKWLNVSISSRTSMSRSRLGKKYLNVLVSSVEVSSRRTIIITRLRRNISPLTEWQTALCKCCLWVAVVDDVVLSGWYSTDPKPLINIPTMTLTIQPWNARNSELGKTNSEIPTSEHSGTRHEFRAFLWTPKSELGNLLKFN